MWCPSRGLVGNVRLNCSCFQTALHSPSRAAWGVHPLYLLLRGLLLLLLVTLQSLRPPLTLLRAIPAGGHLQESGSALEALSVSRPLPEPLQELTLGTECQISLLPSLSVTILLPKQSRGPGNGEGRKLWLGLGLQWGFKCKVQGTWEDLPGGPGSLNTLWAVHSLSRSHTCSPRPGAVSSPQGDGRSVQLPAGLVLLHPHHPGEHSHQQRLQVTGGLAP